QGRDVQEWEENKILVFSMLEQNIMRELVCLRHSLQESIILPSLSSGVSDEGINGRAIGVRCQPLCKYLPISRDETGRNRASNRIGSHSAHDLKNCPPSG